MGTGELFDLGTSGDAGSPLSVDQGRRLANLPEKAIASPEAVQAALDAYHAVALRKNLPCVRLLTSSRIAALRARLKEVNGLAGWLEALDKLELSSFCCGANDRGWKADFDFLLQSSSFARLIEGRYDDRKPARPADTSATSRALAELARSARGAAGD